MAHSRAGKEVHQMKQPKRLSRARLEKEFGITVPRPLTKRQRERCEQINALFDAVVFECGIRERAIFEGAYPNEPKLAHEKLFAFLKNVRTCPKLVIEHAQHLLNESKKK